jgi:hypothetical protein
MYVTWVAFACPADRCDRSCRRHADRRDRHADSNNESEREQDVIGARHRHVRFCAREAGAAWSRRARPPGVEHNELINRAGLGHQPGPEEHDPRNDVLTSAKRAEERKHTKYDAICAATGSVLSPFKLVALEKANARLGSAGGCAAGQAQEGHLVRATPGHDRPSDHPSCPRRLRGYAWPARARPRSSEDKEELLQALNRQATGRRVGIAKHSSLC